MKKIKTLMTGLGFGESPLWRNDLWFSNWVVQDVVAVDMDGKSDDGYKMAQAKASNNKPVIFLFSVPLP